MVCSLHSGAKVQRNSVEKVNSKAQKQTMYERNCDYQSGAHEHRDDIYSKRRMLFSKSKKGESNTYCRKLSS